MKYLKLYEDFDSAKFSIEDIENAIINGKNLFTSVVKDFPENDPEKPLKMVEIDKDTGEVVVIYDGDLAYVDLNNVEKIE